jgi:hypothetical protein
MTFNLICWAFERGKEEQMGDIEETAGIYLFVTVFDLKHLAVIFL